MMTTIPILTFLVNLAANAWLLIIMWRRNVWRSLPWFVSYIAWEFVATFAGLVLWLGNRRLYASVFWWTEAVSIAFALLAIRESFLQTFVGFSSLRWFPWLVRTVIGSVLAYSMWKAIYAPPIQSNRLISFIIAGEFTFRWGFTAVGLLSLVLVWMLELRNDSRETAVMLGIAVASGAFLVNVLSRSFFGTKYVRITQFAPDAGYLIAVAIWIKYMSRPEEQFGFKEAGMTPEQMASELKRYSEAAERILKFSKTSKVAKVK